MKLVEIRCLPGFVRLYLMEVVEMELRKFVAFALCLLLVVQCFGCASTNGRSKDATIETKHSHEYAEANCTTPKTCACGATDGFILGHDFINATCTSSQICSRCGLTNGDALGHSYNDATCTKPRTCSRCKTTDGEKLGHDYSEATCLEPQICKRCSATSGDALGHDYVDYFCSRCGKQDPNSFPVRLDTLPVVDSGTFYEYSDNSLSDNFGNTYAGFHCFGGDTSGNSYAVYYLDGKYTSFSCDVLTLCNEDVSFAIYVDDEMVYKSNKFNKVDGSMHVDIDIKDGQQLKIMAWNHKYRWKDNIYLVNTELSVI